MSGNFFIIEDEDDEVLSDSSGSVQDLKSGPSSNTNSLSSISGSCDQSYTQTPISHPQSNSAIKIDSPDQTPGTIMNVPQSTQNMPPDHGCGTFSICIPDCVHLRFLMDCAGGIRSEGIITMVPDGFFMAHKNRDGTATISVKIHEEKLLEYNIRPSIASNEQVLAHVHTNFKTISSICKPLDKKEHFHVQGAIFRNGWVYKMHNVCRDMADEIPCFAPDTSLYEAYASMKEKYYKGCKPAARVTNGWLVKPMNKFKTGKYTRVNFSIMGGLVIIKGTKGNIVSIAKCPEPSSQDEYEDYSTSDPRSAYQTDGVTIDLKEMKDVLVNMCKISHARSTIKIYLENGKPLVFVIDVGNMGEAEFTFANRVNRTQ